MPVSFFNQRNLGDITNRYSSNVGTASFISHEVYMIIVSLFQIVIYGCTLLLLSFPIFILVIFFILIDFIYFCINQSRTYEKNIGMQMEYGKLASHIESSIQSIETVKATGQDESYYNHWCDALMKYLYQLREYERQQLKIHNFTEFLSQAKPIIILAMGGFMVHAGTLTIGGLVAFTFLANYFFSSSEQLFQIGVSWQHTKATITRVLDIKEHKIDSRYHGKHHVEKNEIKGNIEFQNVSFGYNKNKPPIIENFSLKINSGEQIVLMGATGCGKSTLMKLLQGVYQPWSGKIFIDGIPVEQFNNQSLAKIIGSIDQNLFLFEGTLKENLMLGDYKVKDEVILDLIQKVGLSNLLTQYRKGLDTPIKEQGKNISGGQAQLIEIIRAILLKPAVLIMDEATSALDSLTIQRVMQLLRALSTTNIMVSHQPNLIAQSDKIILLHDGKVIGSGHHKILYESNEYYRQLVSKA